MNPMLFAFALSGAQPCEATALAPSSLNGAGERARVLRPCAALWSTAALVPPLDPAVWLALDLPHAFTPELDGVVSEQRRSPMSFFVAKRFEVGFDVELVPATVRIEIKAPFEGVPR